MLDHGMKEFLMETYVARLDETAAALTATALSAATAKLRARGAAIELLHSFAILREETCFSLFSSSTLADVDTAAKLARVGYDHIAEVSCYRHG